MYMIYNDQQQVYFHLSTMANEDGVVCPSSFHVVNTLFHLFPSIMLIQHHLLTILQSVYMKIPFYILVFDDALSEGSI